MGADASLHLRPSQQLSWRAPLVGDLRLNLRVPISIARRIGARQALIVNDRTYAVTHKTRIFLRRIERFRSANEKRSIREIFIPCAKAKAENRQHVSVLGQSYALREKNYFCLRSSSTRAASWAILALKSSISRLEGMLSRFRNSSMPCSTREPTFSAWAPTFGVLRRSLLWTSRNSFSASFWANSPRSTSRFTNASVSSRLSATAPIPASSSLRSASTNEVPVSLPFSTISRTLTSTSSVIGIPPEHCSLYPVGWPHLITQRVISEVYPPASWMSRANNLN